MSGAWTQEELDFVIDNYKHMSYKDIANHLGRTKAAVDIKINRLGLKKSKYTYDELYFNSINSSEKAYWLGFFYADGYVSIGHYNGKESSYEASIELSEKDFLHLKKFVNCISGNIPVNKFRKVCGTPAKIHDFCSVRVYSKTMVFDLINDGVVQNKSFILKFPTCVKEEYMSHFIRGYFDGNGSVCENKKQKSVRCNFTTASEDFAIDLMNWLINNGIRCYITRYRNILQCNIRGLKNVEEFRKLLYKDSTIYLDRKFDRFNYLYDKLDVFNRLSRLPH